MQNNFKRILVTSALPYANGHIHLGHLAGCYVPSDIYTRYQRLQQREVLHICGSDEHGVAITISAEKEKTTPQAIVDKYHKANKESFKKFGIKFDNYSRTSLPIHHETSKEFFLDLLSKGYLKEKEEEQFYDADAKMFLPDRYVEGTCPNCGNDKARGDQCDNCGKYYDQLELKNPKSLITGKTPIVKKTKHWFFTLGKFQKKLEEYTESHSKDWKDNTLQQTRSWLKEGLQDRAVTRDLSWGIPVPIEGVEGKVLYVWFDAVLGYISSTKEWAIQQGKPEKWKEYWCDTSTRYIAFLGKDNIVFHTIVFPAELMAKGGYILPDNVPANEFLNLEGGKFSKSRNNAIYLKDILERYPADTFRYTLATNLPETKDSDFYWKDFQAKNNNELADIYGNFINRTITFVAKNFENKVPKRGKMNDLDREVLVYVQTAPQRIAVFIEQFKFRDATMEMMNVARAANKYFNDSEPWKSFKTNPEQCGTTLNICLNIVRSLAVLFSPVVPFSSDKVFKMLNQNSIVDNEQWMNAGEPQLLDGHQLGQSEILFTKIEDTTIEQELSTLGINAEAKKENESVVSNYAPVKPQITYDDFAKVDLRIAKIIEAEAVPKSKKLIRLQIDLGFEKRQIVAGIAEKLSPEQLIGKTIIVVANLAPAKLMGVESQGMLLATAADGANFALLTSSTNVDSGVGIK
ncbi:MAG: methionine--tRNA ligase [Bacteroidota bacterium]|nr:methionine--tRNA ligase [Bacteroidota bacterium]